MKLDATDMEYDVLNQTLRDSTDADFEITGLLGQRFIAAGASNRHIALHGTPGNALAAYLNGADVVVYGNAQDAVGDTMNEGTVVVHGNIGDAAGYAMRGGSIYVRGNAGYRAGIHMKAYQDKVPVMIIGGKAGSFLGEYQAGGVIVVLDLGSKGGLCVGDFPCTGMHGGKMFLRSDCAGVGFPEQVTPRPATEEDIAELRGYIGEYCAVFGLDIDGVLAAPLTVVTPDSSNPYRQMYVPNYPRRLFARREEVFL